MQNLIDVLLDFLFEGEVLTSFLFQWFGVGDEIGFDFSEVVVFDAGLEDLIDNKAIKVAYTVVGGDSFIVDFD